MKTLKTIFITAAILCMAGAVYAAKDPGAGGKDNPKQEVRESTGTESAKTGYKVEGSTGMIAGGRIVLEDREIVLLDNGKIISKHYVGKYGEEEKSIVKEQRAKILKKMGLNGEAELQGRELRDKFNEEKRKTFKVNDLLHPRLKFLNTNGNSQKEIILGDERRVFITTDTNSTGESTHFETITSSYAKVSKNQQYALYDEDYADSSTFPGSTGKVKYYDVNGNVIWEKQYPKFKVGSGIVSDDGSKVFLIESWTENWNSLPESEPYYQFVAYDKTGEMIFAFPKIRGQGGLEIGGDIIASPNGRYASVKADKLKKHVLIFFDVANISFWVFEDKEAFVHDISDEGVCRIGLYAGAKIETIDFKNGKFVPLK